MDSISSSTLTTIGQSADVTSPVSKKTASPAGATGPDLIEISTLPSLSQAEKGHGSNSNQTQFQAVLTDAVRELKAAALETSDPFEVAYLLDLAGKFQQLQETGGSGGSGQVSGVVSAG